MQISFLFLLFCLIFNQIKKRALQVFASAACLNASFLDVNGHYNTSTKYPGVDMNQARSLLKVLTDADSNVVNVVNSCALIELSNFLRTILISR